MRIVFAGTPDFAAQHLEALLQNNFNVVAVYTQPDRPAGRGKKLKSSEVKTAALSYELPVCQPSSFKDNENLETLKQWQADIMVVVAYGIILPKSVLSIPTHGCINVHGSLLPKWRGAAPIQRSLWAGDKKTGVTIMQMDEGLDTGPMLLKAAIDIDAKDTSAMLYDKLANVGPKALVEALSAFSNLQPESQQSELATYAKKLSKEEAEIDWRLSGEQLERNCRAFNPWPTVWLRLNEQTIKVWQAHCAEPVEKSYKPGEVIKADKQGLVVATSTVPLTITQLQLPGKKPMAVADILNARSDWFKPGTQL